MTINMHERIFLSGSGRLLDLFSLLRLSHTVKKWAFLSLYPHSCSTSSLRQSTQGPILVVFMILFYFCLQELPKWTLQTLETFLGVLEKKQGFLTQYIFVFKQLSRTCASDFTTIIFRTNLMSGLTLNVCCMVSYNQFNLSAYLPWVEYAHNSFTSSSTSLSTFEGSPKGLLVEAH